MPLVPADVGALVAEHGCRFEVQQSPTRAFSAEDFQAAGATMVAGPLQRPIVLGVKEIPERELMPGRVYVFFSHTIKGQPYNMAMLRRLMELGCTLIDYELILDERGRRGALPMAPAVQSLNVSHAAAIALYELARKPAGD